jgi:hypothetical protein
MLALLRAAAQAVHRSLSTTDCVWCRSTFWLVLPSPAPFQPVSLLNQQHRCGSVGKFENQRATTGTRCRWWANNLTSPARPLLNEHADFATLIGKPTSFFTFPYKDFTVDFMAAGLVVACCLLLIFTTAGGACFDVCLFSGSAVLCQQPPLPPARTPPTDARRLCAYVRAVAGSWFNLLMTGSQVAVIIVILAAGFSKVCASVGGSLKHKS